MTHNSLTKLSSSLMEPVHHHHHHHWSAAIAYVMVKSETIDSVWGNTAKQQRLC